MHRIQSFITLFFLNVFFVFSSNVSAHPFFTTAEVDTVEQYLRIEKAAYSVNPWSHLNFCNDPQNFQFAIQQRLKNAE